MRKAILVVCLECGRKNDRKHKGAIGVWQDTCDLCSKIDVPCASAPHDFGIYSDKETEADDRVQDLI